MTLDQHHVWDILSNAKNKVVADHIIDAMIYALPISAAKKAKKKKELDEYHNFYRQQK